LILQTKRRIRKAARRIFRDLRRRSSMVLMAMVSDPPLTVSCSAWMKSTVLEISWPYHPAQIFLT
jgi:hypothetical protein